MGWRLGSETEGWDLKMEAGTGAGILFIQLAINYSVMLQIAKLKPNFLLFGESFIV